MTISIEVRAGCFYCAVDVAVTAWYCQCCCISSPDSLILSLPIVFKLNEFASLALNLNTQMERDTKRLRFVFFLPFFTGLWLVNFSVLEFFCFVYYMHRICPLYVYHYFTSDIYDYRDMRESSQKSINTSSDELWQHYCCCCRF